MDLGKAIRKPHGYQGTLFIIQSDDAGRIEKGIATWLAKVD
jgi:hypothetical protein